MTFKMHATFSVGWFLFVAYLGSTYAQKHNCNDITSINKCLMVFQQVIQEEPFITTEPQLDRACVVMTNSTKCLDAFYKQCMSVWNKETIDQASSVFSDNVKRLCDDKDYRKEYFKHIDCHQQTTALCMDHLKSTMDFLSTGIKQGSSQDEMRQKLDDICRGTVDYVNCVKMSSRKTCEKEASRFITDFEMSGNKQLRRNCDPEKYKIDDSNSAKSYNINIFQSLLSIACALAIVCLSRFVV